MKGKVLNYLNQLIKVHRELGLLSDFTIEDVHLEHCQRYDTIHLYKCLERIASIIGANVTYNPNYYNGTGMMSFEYDGYTFIELWGGEE